MGLTSTSHFLINVKKSDDTAIIVHTPKGVGNLYRRHFCHDELANLKERCTDEELQQIWNEAFQHFLKDNDSTTESKEMPE